MDTFKRNTSEAENKALKQELKEFKKLDIRVQQLKHKIDISPREQNGSLSKNMTFLNEFSENTYNILLQTKSINEAANYLITNCRIIMSTEEFSTRIPSTFNFFKARTLKYRFEDVDSAIRVLLK